MSEGAINSHYLCNLVDNEDLNTSKFAFLKGMKDK